MENVVPAVLQRLRAADIIRMAGLSVAALGQEYERLGAVQQAQRQGNHLSSVVNVPHIADFSLEIAATTTNTVDGHSFSKSEDHDHTTEVILESPTVWKSACTCSVGSSALCSHACALLYHWISHPFSFSVPAESDVSSTTPSSLPAALNGTNVLFERSEQSIAGLSAEEEKATDLDTEPGRLGKMGALSSSRSTITPRGPTPLANVVDLLAQLSLSELRSMAREYELSPNGLSKLQLVDVIYEALCQPELVRHMAMALEKQQRQLLATLTLAGGSMNDDDLRGMFERFGLGQPPQLQQALATLQSKGLLFRTSLNSSPQQRIGLSGSLLDIGWFVPLEVRNALRVSAPTTSFDIEQHTEAGNKLVVRLAESYRLLSALLLVARVLDGYQLTSENQRNEGAVPPVSTRTTAFQASSRSTIPLSPDGSIALPAPAERPSATMLSFLRQSAPYSTPLLRFAVRLLRLTGVVYTEGAQPLSLHALANAAALLLGSNHAEVTRDLFELWLTQPSYDELFALHEDGVHVRCRATSQHHPLLRPGELEAENSEARQTLVALLAQVPTNRWCNFAAFARFVYRLNPFFLQHRQRLFSLPHWWLEREEGRSLRPHVLSDWMHAEYHYLAHLLRGPLYWWGICDIALGSEGRLLAFRLTPMAEWLLNGIPLDETAQASVTRQETRFEVTGEGDVLVESAIQSWPVIRLLEEFAERASVRDGKLCYCLTPQALGAALSRGLQASTLLELLRARSDEERTLAPLLTQLERWTSSYGRVRLYTKAAMLQAADTSVMRELSATTSFDTHVVQSLHPTLAVLRRSGMEQLIEDLKRRGQMPLLHHEE